MMNYFDTWYTDRVTIYRPIDSTIGSITKKTRSKIAENVKCHIYQTSKPSYTGSETSNPVQANDALSCRVEVDIQIGDELEVTRYKTNKLEKYIAGKPADKIEPFAMAMPGLEHKEVPLTQKERS